jgi:hypothetical protein
MRPAKLSGLTETKYRQILCVSSTSLALPLPTASKSPDRLSYLPNKLEMNMVGIRKNICLSGYSSYAVGASYPRRSL